MIPLFGWMWRVASNADAKKLLAFETFVSQWTSLHVPQHDPFVHCDALVCNGMHYSSLVCTVLPALTYTVPHCHVLSVLHCHALICTVIHCSAKACTVLHWHVFNCIVMHCPAMSCTVSALWHALFCTVKCRLVLLCTVCVEKRYNFINHASNLLSGLAYFFKYYYLERKHIQ